MINAIVGSVSIEIFRTRWQNSPAALLNEFTRVSQSKQQANLYGAPLIITVTALSGHDGGSRSASVVTHNVSEKNLIKVGMSHRLSQNIHMS